MVRNPYPIEMKPVRVEAIPVGGMEIDFLLESSRIKEIASERPLGFFPSGPLKVYGTLNKSGQNVLFRGRIRGSILLECARCLESFSQSLDISIGSEWRVLSTPFKSAQGTSEPLLEELMGEVSHLQWLAHSRL